MGEESLEPGRVLDLIRSRSLEAQKVLIEDLAGERTRRSVSMLLELLSDESWSLRELAVHALSDTEELAAPRLMTLLDAGLWYTRAAAARALGLMAHGPAVPRLLELIDDPNRTISESAAQALVDMAPRGRSVAIARGLVARGDGAEDGFQALDRLDPDVARKLRILAGRDEVAGPVRDWLSEDGPDPEVLAEQHLAVLDEELDVRWEDISGPVGG